MQEAAKFGAFGFTYNELKCAVDRSRGEYVEKRAQAGNLGPKTYDGLKGDTVSLPELFAKVSSKTRAPTCDCKSYTPRVCCA